MGAIHQVLLSLGAMAGGGGGPITWTGISGAAESPAGRLTKNTGNSQWGDCGAVSVESKAGDCRLTYYWESPFTNLKMIGIGTDTSCNNFNTIDFGMNLELSGADPKVSNYHNGAGPVCANSIVGEFDTDTGTMIEIERVGDQIVYYKLPYIGARPSPGDAGRTAFCTPSGESAAGTYYVNIAIYGDGKIVDAADILFSSI